MKVAFFQYDIVWQDKEANFQKVENQLKAGIDADVLVLPEMFSTGFCMEPEGLAEPTEGRTVALLQKWSELYDLAICGSFIALEGGKYYNRGFFITPTNAYYYDKHHLFVIGAEGAHYTAGDKPLIINYRGWNIALQICFDLRFPVWARNVDNAYDLLVYVANWPTSRVSAWNVLLVARAIENQAYVCGVNRVGMDDFGSDHNGCSAVYDFKGNALIKLEDGLEKLTVVEISKEELDRFRKKFPVYRSADRFEIK
ncbi:MAG TPA: nitrilase-related carbon-nitrogen hydrolase [Paludibacteraceae bacterium]|jgi:predicted amidohydrolase|nr:nitrilase-related carbon-nitrogen hydrolase [Paludibacteraceae bacterium]HOU68672.1 nitrilase-related carbon-nitrogen hydrolase [Paludibacteraceae bacterium]HPH63273.1 nitrilase-related carbon-nitrogen hydrolase [Paludibacteraceae bacterium]HQF50478.1 nitrilase-related carbon-nitrogen hydrolase [Paludibacteraceae bacterium]